MCSKWAGPLKVSKTEKYQAGGKDVDGNTLLEMNNSSSFEDFSETSQDTAKESQYVRQD